MIKNLLNNFEVSEIKNLILKTSNENPVKEYPNEYFNYIDISCIDLEKGKIIPNPMILGKEAPSRARQKVKSNDLLVSTVRPNLNAVALVPEELDGQICSTGFCILRSNGKIIPEYLFYFSRTEYFIESLVQRCRGASYPAVTNKDVLSAKIPVPPLEIQKKIVKTLEKVEKLKEWRAESDELADEFLKSVFLDMFGDPVKNEKEWEIKTVEELCSKIVDCPHSTPKYAEKITEFPCIRTTELKNGYIDWKEMKYLNKVEYKERIKRLCPEEGDIIYGREGTFGEAVRVPKNTKISLGQRVMLFRPKKSMCNSTFLWALLRSDAIYHQALQKTSGSTVGHVNIKDIKKFRGFCPPIKLQNQFAEIVKQVETLKTHQKQSKQQIDNLFNALMQKAFKGELTC